jgi:hypothetical protein
MKYTYRFTDGFDTVKLQATSYKKASAMVPFRFRLQTITKVKS